MEKEVEFITRIRKIGDSLFVIVHKNFAEQLNLEEGDNVNVCITKELKIVQSYVCKLCSYHFDSDDEEPYCPACQAEGEDLKIFSKDKELKGGIEE